MSVPGQGSVAGFEIEPGDLYEDCAYHPVKCEEVYPEKDWIGGVSLVDGSRPRGCSLVSCGVRKISQEEAAELLEVWRTQGERGVLLRAGWTEKAIEEFMERRR